MVKRPRHYADEICRLGTKKLRREALAEVPEDVREWVREYVADYFAKRKYRKKTGVRRG